MITEDQTAVIDFMAAASTHGGAAVERIDTHTAVVFLAGARAYKLKRAVRFDYLDFSTVERRRVFCDAEVRLNQRTAPTLYRRLVAVTRAADGALMLDGAGPAVDWLVEMNRFSQDALFDRLAAAEHLDPGMMPSLAEVISSFHAAAERRVDHAGTAGMRWVIDGNAEGFAEFGTACLDTSTWQRVIDDSHRELERRAALLDTRREGGYVRHCHGDLHLRNIVLIDGRPTLFDGVEFNDEISCIDVLYDLAFLLMDLWRRKLTRHANLVWNRYLAATQDLHGVSLLPLFLSCRAAVRAKTSATAARFENDGRRRGELEELSRQYVNIAGQFLHPPPPSLIAIGGFSGSGKSTLAAALAPSVGPVPGAVVLRSDELRKQLRGVAPLERLGPEAYADEMSRHVYQTLAERATAVIRAGHTAMVDAVYGRPLARQAIERVATDAAAPFVGLWLDVGEKLLVERVTGRRNDPSDATADVVRMQLRQETGQVAWRRLDASESPDRVLQSAVDILGAQQQSAGRQNGLIAWDWAREASRSCW